MKSLIHKNDKYKMNWIEGKTEWGTVKCPEGIQCSVKSEHDGDNIIESYTFKNVTDKYIFTSLTDIAIYATFNDDYKDSDTCFSQRCHTHIWCGGEVSYVMALRMGGEAPHLGLTLTKGSLGGYSVERDFDKMSNDRGDFLLHPSPVSLAPGEEMTIEWTLFWHEGRQDFYKKLGQYNKRFMDVKADNYIVFAGEKIRLNITPAFDFTDAAVRITLGGREVPFVTDGTSIVIEETVSDFGEYRFDIDIDGTKTYCCVLVQPDIETLSKKRCRFIAENQQYISEGSPLDGALLIYDNEEKHMFYRNENDYNAARERIGMGLLLAKYLQKHDDAKIKDCIERYTKYVLREMFDEKTGMVYNDYGRDNSYFRLYNFPWASMFFIELYRLYKDKKHIERAYKALLSFYENGGAHFYAIEVPLCAITECMEKENMTSEAELLTEHFRNHCDFICKTGTSYPAHEVNYEQSIVAPAANTLLQMYMLTNEEKYLDGARVQMRALELFNGMQPDYHMHEVAVRHWDGYWFGKRRLYGDTYPHYWSALTANAYKDFGKITGDKEYFKKAELAYRGVLSLINADGTASCACVYPASVNGIKADYRDPYANDQDWGLYFMLRHIYG